MAGAASAAITTPAGAVARRSAAATAPHVMVLWMENTDYSQFAGSPAMPYLNELAHEYADVTEAYGWSYPSLPNYLELLAGTDFGITDDCDITEKGCNNFVHERIIDQLEAAGIPWAAYFQGDAYGCDQSDGTNPNYPYWHNSFRYFADFSTQCSHLSDFTPLLGDLDAASPPDFVWVVPDLVNSGGDNGTMSSGDTFLANEVPRIMGTRWYREGGQIVIIYDTGYNDQGGIGTSSGGHIPLVVVSAHDRGLGYLTRPVDTAGVLRSIEKAYGFPYIGDAADPQNGSLGAALVPGRPTGPPARQDLEGAVVSVHGGRPLVEPSGEPTLGLEGISCAPGASCWEVGTSQHGQGVVVFPDGSVSVVPGTANLESVSCSSDTRCYAVGLAPQSDDESVVVSLTRHSVTSVSDDGAFIGLYGVDCVSASTCYAVGYDNADDAGAVTTLDNGVPSPPNEVAGDNGTPWLNAISCPTPSQCYAAGLWNYEPAIIPITSGVPGKAEPIGTTWYASGIDCPSVGNCLTVGENEADEGVVAALVDGKLRPAQVVSGTEYLYGVSCAPDGSCLLAGTSAVGTSGEGTGVLSTYYEGVGEPAHKVPGTNGLGQVVCGSSITDCVAVGART